MLLRFTVGNFRSFKEPQTFSMLPGKVRSKENHLMKNNDLSVLRFASISGANASGKSNLIKAVGFVQETILHGLPKNAFDDHFRETHGLQQAKPSTFEFDLMIDGRYYTYGFDIYLGIGQVISEWLYEIVGDNHREKLLFKRYLEKEDDIATFNPSYVLQVTDTYCAEYSAETIAALEVYASGLSKPDLLLSEMNLNRGSISLKYPELKPLFDIYAWFAQKLRIVYPNTSLLSTPEETLISLNSSAKNEIALSEVVSILQQLGVGISDLKLQRVSKEELMLMFTPVEMNMYQTLLVQQIEMKKANVAILQDRITHQRMILEVYKDRKIEFEKEKELLKIRLDELALERACSSEELAYLESLYKELITTDPDNLPDIQKCRIKRDKLEICLKEIDIEIDRIETRIQMRFCDHEKSQSMVEEAESEFHILETKLNSLLEDLAGLESPSDVPVLERGYLVRCEHGLLFMGIADQSKEPIVMRIQFEHLGYSARFDIKEESNGTKRLLDLIEILCAAKSKSEITYLVDEVDMSLHPHLTKKLISMFLELGDGGATQCIVTTHEAHMLDLTLLRRDEIWFVAYKRKEDDVDPHDRNYGVLGSVLYSLEEFNERFDKRVDKAYLEGSYGAIPRFLNQQDVVESLSALSADEEKDEE